MAASCGLWVFAEPLIIVHLVSLLETGLKTGDGLPEPSPIRVKKASLLCACRWTGHEHGRAQPSPDASFPTHWSAWRLPAHGLPGCALNGRHSFDPHFPLPLVSYDVNRTWRKPIRNCDLAV